MTKGGCRRHVKPSGATTTTTHIEDRVIVVLKGWIILSVGNCYPYDHPNDGYNQQECHNPKHLVRNIVCRAQSTVLNTLVNDILPFCMLEGGRMDITRSTRRQHDYTTSREQPQYRYTYVPFPPPSCNPLLGFIIIVE